MGATILRLHFPQLHHIILSQPMNPSDPRNFKALQLMPLEALQLDFIGPGQIKVVHPGL